MFTKYAIIWLKLHKTLIDFAGIDDVGTGRGAGFRKSSFCMFMYAF